MNGTNALPGYSLMASGHPGRSLRARAKRAKNWDQKITSEVKIRSTKIRLQEEERVSVIAMAEHLRRELPRSEKWFQMHWRKSGMLHEQDLFNYRFGPFIPDCMNRAFNYIIEIDGSIHDSSSIKKKDLQRDEFFRKNGFKVFRVRAFDLNALKSVVNQIQIIRKING